MRYIKQVLIALDQLATALLGGWADETLSSYAFRLDEAGKPWGRFWRPCIDWLFSLFGQDRHCYRAWRAEVLRRQMPPSLR